MRARLWAAVAAACLWGCTLPSLNITNVNDNEQDDRIEGTITGTEDGSDLVVGLACTPDTAQSSAICTWTEGPARATLEASDGSRVFSKNVANGEPWDIVQSDSPTTWTICASDEECSSVSLQS